MPPANSIEDLLDKLKKAPEVQDATLVSRSGMHIAGDIPENAHRETFVAMSAILLGAAETATSELKEELSHVVIELRNSRILIQNGGPSALLAIKLTKKGDVDKTIEDSTAIIENIKKLL
ncbi:MAG: roadblock/LC7 domain-containing protein [Thermoplasmata archaeon]